jgi:hypothetical protein
MRIGLSCECTESISLPRHCGRHGDARRAADQEVGRCRTSRHPVLHARGLGAVLRSRDRGEVLFHGFPQYALRWIRNIAKEPHRCLVWRRSRSAAVHVRDSEPYRPWIASLSRPSRSPWYGVSLREFSPSRPLVCPCGPSVPTRASAHRCRQCPNRVRSVTMATAERPYITDS